YTHARVHPAMDVSPLGLGELRDRPPCANIPGLVAADGLGPPLPAKERPREVQLVAHRSLVVINRPSEPRQIAPRPRLPDVHAVPELRIHARAGVRNGWHV